MVKMATKKNNLQKIMDKEGISVQELSEASGVKSSYILELMAHGTNVGINSKVKIVKGLNKLCKKRYTRKIVFPNKSNDPDDAIDL